MRIRELLRHWLGPEFVRLCLRLQGTLNGDFCISLWCDCCSLIQMRNMQLAMAQQHAAAQQAALGQGPAAGAAPEAGAANRCQAGQP